MEHQELAASSLSFGTYISVEPDFIGVPEFAREAEDLGYQRLSLGEHLMDGNPPRPTVLSIPALAAAGGATSRIRLLAGVVLIPLYEPVMLAKLASTLDIVTGGRLEFGIGIGGQRDTYAEYDAVGIPVGERGRRADEILRLIMRLWTEAHVSFEGRYYRCRDVTLVPPPLQKPHPPIWVAGREEAAMRRAARYGDGWYPYLFTPRRFRESVGHVRKYAAEYGRDLSNFRWGLLQPTCIADTKEEALELAATILGRRYATAQRTPRDIAQALCITGTAQDCIEELEKRVEAGARDIVFMWVANDAGAAREQMREAARNILPHFRSRVVGQATRGTSF